MVSPVTGWVRRFKPRPVAAAVVGAILLVFAIWLDIMWVVLLVLMMLAGALLFIRWLVETFRPGSFPRDDRLDE